MDDTALCFLFRLFVVHPAQRRPFLRNLIKALFPILFGSALAAGGMNEIGMHHPRGRFNYFGRTNGASRTKKTNRLRMSTNTKNRQRRRAK